MKKQLLSESEVRKMMKFANIGSLANPFVDRMNEMTEMGGDPFDQGPLTEEEEDEEMSDIPPDDDDMAAGDDDMAADAVADDMPGDMPMGDEPEGGAEGGGDIDPVDTDTALAGVKAMMQAAIAGFKNAGMDDVVSAIGFSSTDEPAAEDAAMAPEEPVEGPAVADATPAGPPPVPDAEEEEPDMDQQFAEALDRAGIQMQDDESLVNEVARRVAARLLSAKRARR